MGIPESEFPGHYPISKRGELREEYIEYLKACLQESNHKWDLEMIKEKFGIHLEQQIHDGAAKQNFKKNLRAAIQLHILMSNLPVEETGRMWKDVVGLVNTRLKLAAGWLIHIAGTESSSYEEFLGKWDSEVDKKKWNYKGRLVLFQCPKSVRWKSGKMG